MADIVRSVMMETGISVTDLLAAAIEVARREYPAELLKHRDDIMQRLYGGVQCVECANMGTEHVHPIGALESEVSDVDSQNSPMEEGQTDISGSHEHVHSTEELVSEIESQNPSMEQGKASISDLAEVAAAKGGSHEEEPSERPRLRVVIRFKKKEILSVNVPEGPKSENEMKTLSETTTRSSHNTNESQNMVLKNEDISEVKFENAKRKLHESYALAAHAKKQRCVKILSVHELPKEGSGRMCLQT